MKSRVVFSLSVMLWTIAISISLAWNIYVSKESTFQLVKGIGETFFKEIETTRSWNAKHGEVYVPVSEHTKPNPYLDVPNRDITTTTGKRYTLINPAFMTRQIADIAKSESDVQYNITSLNPIRPENKADDWEKQALSQFETGLSDVTEFIEEDLVYRYMAPLFVKLECLQCHHEQGYEVGEVRGGISITIPAEIYIESDEESRSALFLVHALFWIVGIAGLYMFYKYRENQLVILHQKNLTLNSEIDERKKTEKQLIVAKTKAESANIAKSEFLANMSHELRTPFNAILGFTELMLYSDKVDKEHQGHLQIVKHSGENLLQLINQVLDLSKIESGKMELNLRQFHLHTLLDDLIDVFKIIAKNKKLDLLFNRGLDVPNSVLGDEMKLRQVLTNLLGNAFKFTKEGSVALRVWQINAEDSQPTDSPKIRFEVEDTGPGIDASEMESLFESFVQTSAGKESQEGTGLGLPLSQKIVRLMEGELNVSSEPEVSTTFSFDIALTIVESNIVKSDSQRKRVIGIEENHAKHKILVVDDRKFNRLLLTKLLNPLGFDVREAIDGQEAINTWETWGPDFIWMDMKMPVMDGYQATRRIKSTEQGKQTIIVAITASVLEEKDSLIEEIGCDGFLRKPFQQHEIYDLMAEFLNIKFIYADFEET